MHIRFYHIGRVICRFAEGNDRMSQDYDPREEYTRRLAARRETAARAASHYAWLANLRLVVFILGVAMVIGALKAPWLSVGWLVLPVAAFLALVVLHERVLRAKTRADSAVAFYETALARLDGLWAGRGQRGEGLAPDNHPYARDLDVFGEGSLFELICAARTRAGQQTLAAWFCDTVSADVARQRQEAVKELRARLDLREDLAQYGGEIRAELHPRTLAAWATSPPVLNWRHWRRVACVFTILIVLALPATAVTRLPALFLFVVIPELFCFAGLRKQIARVWKGVVEPGRELGVLAKVLARFEQEPFDSEHLLKLQTALTDESVTASRHIAALNRLIELREIQQHQILGFAVFPFMWWLHLVCAMERWRMRWGGHVPQWVEAVGELEALCSLAAYAYERPYDVFPEIADEGPVFNAVDLGHPLLPDCVRNEVHLDGGQRLLVVSGANMSGKSTLLRSVGVNAVLAQMGAPVNAKSLSVSPLAIGATLRVQDSIRRGISHFYAEIAKLKQMMDLTEGSYPMLFLLDEILHGTNSRDRRIGAAAIVQAFVQHGAVGLITTHDLAVTKVVDTLAPHAANAHFAGQFAAGKLTFDYKLRPGVVQESNALDLMRSIGLPV
jgi:MutS domain V